VLDRIVMQAAAPRFRDRVGMARRDAVRTTLAIWTGCAFCQHTKLRSLWARAAGQAPYTARPTP